MCAFPGHGKTDNAGLNSHCTNGIAVSRFQKTDTFFQNMYFRFIPVWSFCIITTLFTHYITEANPGQYSFFIKSRIFSRIRMQ